jgi:hypothetical protein
MKDERHRTSDGVVVYRPAHPSSLIPCLSPCPAYRDAMPRGEWDDNSWYDDGDFPPVSKNEGRGGMVAAAVFSYLMCAVNALSATCFGFVFLFWALVGAANQGVLPADMVQVFVFFFAGVVVASGISFFLQLFAGIGLARGRRRSRTITLWLAGYSMLVAVGLVAAVIYTYILNGGNEDSEPWAVIMFGFALVHGTYAIVEFSLLLQPSIARRYR